MARKTILEVTNLVKTYGEGRARTEAVKGISFKIERGEFAALAGPSGSGKSTTFHQIALLDTPTSGTITFNSVNIQHLREEEQANFRLQNIGYIFQRYELLSELTALENVYLPLMVEHGKTREILRRAEHALAEMGLLERKDHYPHELSGGEQQRVAIARAIVKNPDILFADEPTANLDSKTGKQIIQTLQRLNKEKGITVFIINHETEYEPYFEKIIRLKDGRIEKIEETKRR